MKCAGLFSFGLLSLAACGSEPSAPTARPATEAPSIQIPAAAIETARAALQKEPAIKSAAFRQNENVAEWQIAVADNGTKRYGYAETVCMTLSDAGARNDVTEVHILDEAKRVAANNVDVIASASLGGIRCKDGQHLY